MLCSFSNKIVNFKYADYNYFCEINHSTILRKVTEYIQKSNKEVKTLFCYNYDTSFFFIAVYKFYFVKCKLTIHNESNGSYLQLLLLENDLHLNFDIFEDIFFDELKAFTNLPIKNINNLVKKKKENEKSGEISIDLVELSAALVVHNNTLTFPNAVEVANRLDKGGITIRESDLKVLYYNTYKNLESSTNDIQAIVLYIFICNKLISCKPFQACLLKLKSNSSLLYKRSEYFKILDKLITFH